MRLTPYGSMAQAHNIAKVGKKMTSPSLAARMPSAEIAAKVGFQELIGTAKARRVVRRSVQS